MVVVAGYVVVVAGYVVVSGTVCVSNVMFMRVAQHGCICTGLPILFNGAIFSWLDGAISTQSVLSDF